MHQQAFLFTKETPPSPEVGAEEAPPLRSVAWPEPDHDRARSSAQRWAPQAGGSRGPRAAGDAARSSAALLVQEERCLGPPPGGAARRVLS